MTDEPKPIDANDADEGENKPYQPPEDQPADTSDMFAPPPMDATPPPMDYTPPSAEPLDWQSASAFEGAEPVEPVSTPPVEPFEPFAPPPAEPTSLHTPEPTFIPPPISSGSAYTPPSAVKKNGTKWWVIAIIIVAVLCCCCAAVAAVLWFFGDQIFGSYWDYSWLIGSLVL
jgi:hypothetical protein